MTAVHFAQISDIHISSLGDHDDMLSGHTAGFLSQILAELNQNETLDFVLFSGDLIDTAAYQELERFQDIVRTLTKPYYVIPGNHDRRSNGRSDGLTRRQFCRHFNPQFASRPSSADSQAGYWSMALNADIQLIGLDSIRDADWGGVVDADQLEWLQTELGLHSDKLVIVAIHHPLHPLAPIDSNPDWSNFVCDNGPEVLRLLDNHPQVKLVLTGHHHLTRVDRLASRLHLACPSIASYPCAYRTFRLSRQSEAGQGWQLTWHTQAATDRTTTAKARNVMVNAWQQVGFEADVVEDYAALVLGDEFDRSGTAIL